MRTFRIKEAGSQTVPIQSERNRKICMKLADRNVEGEKKRCPKVLKPRIDRNLPLSASRFDSFKKLWDAKSAKFMQFRPLQFALLYV